MHPYNCTKPIHLTARRLFRRLRHHWDLDVLDAMAESFFVGIMGVPNATGLWQVADIMNNGVLKIKWVQAKKS